MSLDVGGGKKLEERSIKSTGCGGCSKSQGLGVDLQSRAAGRWELKTAAVWGRVGREVTNVTAFMARCLGTWGRVGGYDLCLADRPVVWP